MEPMNLLTMTLAESLYANPPYKLARSFRSRPTTSTSPSSVCNDARRALPGLLVEAGAPASPWVSSPGVGSLPATTPRAGTRGGFSSAVPLTGGVFPTNGDPPSCREDNLVHAWPAGWPELVTPPRSPQDPTACDAPARVEPSGGGCGYSPGVPATAIGGARVMSARPACGSWDDDDCRAQRRARGPGMPTLDDLLPPVAGEGLRRGGQGTWPPGRPLGRCAGRRWVRRNGSEKLAAIRRPRTSTLASHHLSHAHRALPSLGARASAPFVLGEEEHEV